MSRRRRSCGLVLAALLPALVVACAGEDGCVAPPDPGGAPGVAGYALLFCGTGRDRVDRVMILVDDPLSDSGSPAVDVGDTDFTIEWWMKASQEGNRQPRVGCGENFNWIGGNIILDRDRFNQGRKYGVSLGDGAVAFGVSGEGESHRTICGSTNVTDGDWHHVAVQRRASDGEMSIWVDGRLDAREVGPAGDVSYPDDGVPLPFCGGPCWDSDPFLVIGAEKHDAGADYPSYTGWMDELRISSTLRYSADFQPPAGPFGPDSATVGLWHFDEGSGHVLVDSSGGGAHGLVRIGGPHAAPRWGVSDAPLR